MGSPGTLVFPFGPQGISDPVDGKVFVVQFPVTGRAWGPLGTGSRVRYGRERRDDSVSDDKGTSTPSAPCQ